jgi:hypothetical protein
MIVTSIDLAIAENDKNQIKSKYCIKLGFVCSSNI